jgi:hypothetical protein
MHETQHLEI